MFRFHFTVQFPWRFHVHKVIDGLGGVVGHEVGVVARRQAVGALAQRDVALVERRVDVSRRAALAHLVANQEADDDGHNN